MYLPYSPGELAAWAMKPFWGLHENLLPEPDLLEGSLEAVILLVAHAFRLGLNLSVAALYPLEEFLTFAEAQPIYTQTLLDQQFNFEKLSPRHQHGDLKAYKRPFSLAEVTAHFTTSRWLT